MYIDEMYVQVKYYKHCCGKDDGLYTFQLKFNTYRESIFITYDNFL